MSSPQEELDECLQQLAEVNEQIKESPSDETLIELKTELEDVIKLLREQVASSTQNASESKQTPPKELPEKTEPSEPPRPPSPKHAPPPPREPTEPRPSQPPQPHAVGDLILAFSADKQWHRAKITSVTGSRESPLYTVKFSVGNSVETVGKDNIRPLPGRDPKAQSARESVPAVSAPQYSGAPPMKVAKASQEAESKPRPVKQSTAKLLHQGQSKWQEFQRKGVKIGGRKVHALGENSMFRTSDKPPTIGQKPKRPGFKKLG